MTDPGRPSVLLGLTGLRISGGIAAVSRSVARVLDGEARAGRLERTDRVLLLEDPAADTPPPIRGEQRLARSSQLRFVFHLWRSFRRHRHDWVFFDHVGLARAAQLPLPGFPPPATAVFVHGIELEGIGEGARARPLQRARVILANSGFTARRLGADAPDLADRIRVVPLCIDPERTELWDADAGGEDAGRREPAALIVGRMWVEERGKGHDALIEAWPAVRRRVPDAVLWIAGSGRDAARLGARARELGVGDAVEFLGRVSDQELGRLYRRASLFAMPSRQEGFGLVYAEAMWCGAPCVGSTDDAAGDVIVDGETGLLVPYGRVDTIADAVADLLAHPERASAMGEAGRARARRAYSFERFRADLLAALALA